MSNTMTALNPTLWQSTVQDYLTNMLVAKPIAMTKFEVGLEYGRIIEFPELSDVYLQTYTPGTDLTGQPIVSTSSQLTINTAKAALLDIDHIEKIQAKADYQVALSKQLAYQLANDIDAAVLSTGVSGAALTATGGTLDTASMYQAMLDADTVLYRNRAYSNGAQKFAVMPQKYRNLLASTFVANGFNSADTTLRNGFEGFAQGFDVYSSNNLPASQALTIATNPTANDTITLFGVTLTFVASATNAGEITIGANAAATQTNLSNFINNTSTGFVDVSQENRSILTNARVAISSWGSNLATITGAGYIGGTSVFTSGNNFWGTETTKILFGVKGAIALATQMEPTIKFSDKPKQFGNYMKGIDLYGTKVFSRSGKRLYALTVNA